MRESSVRARLAGGSSSGSIGFGSEGGGGAGLSCEGAIGGAPNP